MKERLDIVDENGEPTGQTVDREVAHCDGIRHRTSHVWLVRKGPTDALEVLLQKRSADKDAFPGCWDISSAGHIPAGDDWKTSALRELKEELGVEVRPEDLHWLGNHNVESDGVFHGRPFHNRQISAVFVLPLDKPESEFVLQASEIEAVRWMDIDECIRTVENKTIPNCISTSELLWVKSNVLSGACGEELKRIRG